MAEGFRGVHAFVCVTEGKTCCMDAASEWLEWTRWLSSAFHTSWCAAHRMCGRAPVTARSLYFGFIVLPTGFNVQRLGPGWRKQLIWFTSCLRCPEPAVILGILEISRFISNLLFDPKLTKRQTVTLTFPSSTLPKYSFWNPCNWQ